jgi:hypothetical protein
VANTDQETRARDAIRRQLPEMKRSLSKDGSRQFFRTHLQIENVERLIGAAREGNADALEILREHARGARQTGMQVPTEFHVFVWEYFVDGPPKAPPGPKLQDSLLRAMIVVSLVKVVSEEFGFPVYRNKSRHNAKIGPFSACAIVAQELRLSESTVEAIWNDGKANVGRVSRPQ